jgi:hypothetical protein
MLEKYDRKVAWNKSSLILKNILQNTQTLQLFKLNIKKKVFTKVPKMPIWKGLVERSGGLLKEGWSKSALSKISMICFVKSNECLVRVYICN